MIRISVSKSNDFISNVTIKGHSGYSESGSDIVCASVSSIAITTVNAIVRVAHDVMDYENRDGLLSIKIKRNEKIVNILINNMIELFKELEDDYPKNIKITFN